MKIATWNINGIRSGAQRLREFLKAEDPDILCLQEVKTNSASLPADLKNIDGYFSYFHFAEKPGYSGVAIYSKIKPERFETGIGIEEFDREGRVIWARFKDFDLVNFYFPHSGRELQRLDFKFRFNDAFSKYIKKFNRKRLICCGDFNVAHNDIDLARPKDNRKNAGFTEAERKWMDKIVNAGMIDIYRKLYPDKQEFSWWSNMRNARARNIGWRIDYFLCFNEVFKKIRDCRIETHVFGSDHCPVILKLET